MAKKSLGILFLELTVIFLWLFFIGQANGTSGIYGDVNLIDEGQAAAWINHMLHGKMMYKDFFVSYGPLLVYPLYFLVKTFGASIFILRFGMTIIGVFLGVCVVLIVLKYLRIHLIIRAITAFFIIIIPGVHIRHWLGILCLVSIVHTYKMQSAKLSVVTGVLLAIALLVSTEVGIFAALLSLGYMVVKKNARLAAITILSFIVFLVIFALFALNEGWLISYIKNTSEFLVMMSGVNLLNGQGLPNIFEGHDLSLNPAYILKFLFSKAMLFYWSLLFLLLFLGIAVIRWILRKRKEKETVIFLIICFSILTYASIIGRSGHYLIMVPFVIICGSYFISLMFPLSKVKDNSSKAISILFLVIFILYGIRHIIIFRYTPFFNLSRGQFTNNFVPRIKPISISEYQARNILLLQDYFNKNTKPTDVLFIFDNAPALYFLLNRENATEFDLPFVAFSHAKRIKLVSELRDNLPRFILDDIRSWAIDGVSNRQRLPEVYKYIKTHYRIEAILGSVIVYKYLNKD